VYGISAGVTQVLSNVPTLLLVGPWALTVAQLAHWPVAPFVLAPAIAVSTSPLLPTGNKTSLLVLEAGGYTRREFWMFSLPLTVGMGVLTTWGLTRG